MYIKSLTWETLGTFAQKIKEHNGWRIRKKKSVEPE